MALTMHCYAKIRQNVSATLLSLASYVKWTMHNRHKTKENFKFNSVLNVDTANKPCRSLDRVFTHPLTNHSTLNSNLRRFLMPVYITRERLGYCNR
jgi:hypothetical protein